ncbi:MAG: 50S ribosomal protein L32, partial [Pseudomonadota bacterium]
MAVPKFRTSKSKRDMRRSHHFLTAPGSSVCK